jgi:hypothetical protein
LNGLEFLGRVRLDEATGGGTLFEIDIPRAAR